MSVEAFFIAFGPIAQFSQAHGTLAANLTSITRTMVLPSNGYLKQLTGACRGDLNTTIMVNNLLPPAQQVFVAASAAALAENLS